MAGVALADIIALVLRLAFLLLLYAGVFALFLALRRGLVATQAAGAGRSARLVLIEASPSDGPPGRSIALVGEVTLGRRAACEVVLRDDSVSGRHARVRRRGGRWEVEDLGSTNGTFVNGERIDAPQPLRSGDVLSVGTARWQFEVAA